MAGSQQPDWTSLDALLSTWTRLYHDRQMAGRKEPPRGVDGMSASAFEARHREACSEISRMLNRSDAEGGAPTAYRLAPLLELERLERELGRHNNEIHPGGKVRS